MVLIMRFNACNNPQNHISQKMENLHIPFSFKSLTIYLPFHINLSKTFEKIKKTPGVYLIASRWLPPPPLITLETPNM